jgi:hypothetical protein
MQGPGSFANLTVAPDEVEGLSPAPLKDPTEDDRRLVRNWMVSPWTTFVEGKDPEYAELPDASQAWKPLTAERGGLVNLTRQEGLPEGQMKWDLAWLKTDVISDKAQSKHVSIGWTREIWVFVNGKRVFADKNLYQPPAARKTPDGRLSLENGSFDLPLNKGKNEIAIALANNFYGWGIEMRFDDVNGLKVNGVKAGIKIPEGKGVLAAQK